MVVNARAKLYLFDFDRLLALALLGRLLLFEKPVFPEIEDLADGGAGVGDNLDEIEARFLCQTLRVDEVDDPPVLSLAVDELNLDGADITVDAGAAFLRRRDGLDGSTNGASPKNVDPMRGERPFPPQTESGRVSAYMSYAGRRVSTCALRLPRFSREWRTGATATPRPTLAD